MSRRRIVVVGGQRGLTLVELMIAMTMGLFILLGLTGLLLSSSASYLLQDQQAQVQETGRYALEAVARAVRQAGYRAPTDAVQPVLSMLDGSGASVRGLDARTLKKNAPELEASTSGVVNGSDVLALRFAGEEAAGRATMFNCAGFAVPAAPGGEDAHGWSIFFVARDAVGEAELRCKYRTASGWSADAIARGIESFQVLYGLALDGAEQPLRYLRASAIDALDAAADAAGSARPDMAEASSHWYRVRAVRIGLLVSGGASDRRAHARRSYDLFGAEYAERHAAVDQGVRIVEETLPAAARHRLRAVFTQTIRLRNDPAAGALRGPL